MSVATEITRLQSARDDIRVKLTELGLADATAKLDDLATAIENIENRGAIHATVVEGVTYTIPKGYHNGSGTVQGLTDTTGEAEKYKTQAKEVTPTKSEQNVTPDSGYYALSSVTVNPIPVAFQNVTSVTAEATDVLTGKTIVTADGTVTAGTMPNNGTVTKTLDTSTTSVAIAKGYHSGAGSVSISTETKTATPTKSKQTVSPSTGKVLGSVVVNPIPDDYILTIEDPDVSASASNILVDKVAYVNSVRVEGTMPNNGAIAKILDTTTTSYTVPTGYHNGNGAVSISLETKSATPTKSAQTITPTQGKVLSKVTVNAIPAQYITTTDATAKDTEILQGATAYVNGVKVTGAMPNNGTISNTIDGLTVTSVSIPAGYTTGGTVSLTNDIESQLASI